MTEQQIRAVVEQVLARLGQDAPRESTGAPAAPGDPLPDISAIDLRRQYLVESPHDQAAFLAMKERTPARIGVLVESPHDQAAFLAMKERTPARIGVGRAGARYRTETMLRFQADHAAAQDAVFSDVPEEFIQQMGWQVYQTSCESREEFLTRPDKGRVFPADTLQKIKASIPAGTQVVLYVADGLSSSAVHANAAESSTPTGAMTINITAHNPYTAATYSQSRRLSDCLIKAYCTATGAKSEGVVERDDLTGNNWAKVPTTLIEVGYMTNPTEDKLMQTDAYQTKMVQGIANGIDQFFAN